MFEYIKKIYNILFKLLIYSSDPKCIFSIITPVFSVTWSSEFEYADLLLKKHLLLFLMLIFLWNRDTLFFVFV